MAIYVITDDCGYDGTEITTVECAPADLELIREGYKPMGSMTIQSLDEWAASLRMSQSTFDKLTAKPKRGIWWLALDEGDINALLKQRSVANHELWTYLEDLDVVPHWHVTLAFDVTKVDKPEVFTYERSGGEPYNIAVKGLAYNDKCAAFVVDLGKSRCCNKHPHITLATAEGVKPVYSNDMLAGKDGAYNFLPLEAELEGTLEFFEFS